MESKTNFRLMLAIITFALLHIAGLGLCFDMPDYLLFGTKTSYEHSREYLKKLEDWPYLFNGITLEHQHRLLTNRSYKPIMMYQFVRHAIRYPKSGLIKQMEDELKPLIEEWKSSGRANDPKFKDLLEWEPRFSVDESAHTAPAGQVEQNDLFSRFKNMYPDFYKTSTANIEVAFTKAKRTAQSSFEIISLIEGSKVDQSELIRFTKESKKSLENIGRQKVNLESDKSIGVYLWPELQMLKLCKIIHGSKFPKQVPLGELARRFDYTKRIFERLEIPIDSYTIDKRKSLIKTMYDACRYELFGFGSSVWCTVFDNEDLKILDYLEDVEVLLEDCYGPESRPEMACPVIKDLLEKLESSMKEESNDGLLKTYIFFSHSDSLKKLLAYLGVGRYSNGFRRQEVEEFSKTGKVPQHGWVSSLIAPFSGNMTFILYKKENSNAPTDYEILTILNETPVRVNGCNGICDPEDFKRTYSDAKQCDLFKICA